jgi:hypothetical protein
MINSPPLVHIILGEVRGIHTRKQKEYYAFLLQYNLFGYIKKVVLKLTSDCFNGLVFG